MQCAIDLYPYRNEWRTATFPFLRRLEPEQLHRQPSGSPNAIAFYLCHLGQSEDWFVQACILAQPDFVPRRRREMPDLNSMLTYMEETRRRTEELLSGWPPDKLWQQTRSIPPGFRGAPRQAATLYWIFHRVFLHEVYHGAQIILLLRQLGFTEVPVI